MGCFMKEKILSDVKNEGFSIVESFIDKEITANARQEYLEIQKTQKLHSQKKRFSLNDLEQRPWRKSAIGSGNGNGYPIAQVLQTAYFREVNSGVTNLSAAASSAIAIRNILDGKPEKFGMFPEKDRFWNATRVHHYPQGGGFMSSHKDTYFPDALNLEEDLSFLQFAVLLSTKGTDFYEGGAFVVSAGGEKIMLDDKGAAGTLVVFDGRMLHGVDDVDPNEVLDWSNPKGRIAIFSNLYKFEG